MHGAAVLRLNPNSIRRPRWVELSIEESAKWSDESQLETQLSYEFDAVTFTWFNPGC